MDHQLDGFLVPEALLRLELSEVPKPQAALDSLAMPFEQRSLARLDLSLAVTMQNFGLGKMAST